MGFKYSNVSKVMALAAPMDVSQVEMTVDDASGLPVTFPFRIALGYETTKLEIVYCTARTANTMTISRGQEDTPAQTHSTAEIVVHAWTAGDGQDISNHIDGSQNVHGVGVGSSVVGTGTTQVLTGKTLDGAVNTFSNIPGSAIGNSPVFHNVTVDNEAATGQAALVVETEPASTAESQIIRVRNGATGLALIPGDATDTGGDFINAQTLGSVSRFRVAKPSGNTTVGGTLAVTGTSILSGDTTVNAQVTINQAASGNGLRVNANAASPSPTVFILGTPNQPGLNIERDNATDTGFFVRCRTEGGGGNLIELLRDGRIRSANTVRGSDFLIAGTPDRSVEDALDSRGIIASTQVTNNTPNTTSATYVSIGTQVGVVFTAPPSGNVMVDWFSEILVSASGVFGLVTIEVRTGGTVGSGTLVVTAADTLPLARNDLNFWICSSAWHDVNGLTAGNTYNTRIMGRTTGTMSIGRRGIRVNATP